MPADQKAQYHDYYTKYFTYYLATLNQQAQAQNNKGQTINGNNQARETPNSNPSSTQIETAPVQPATLPEDPAPQLPPEEEGGSEEIDPLDAFMAENNEEAIKDLEESVVTTKMDRLKEMNKMKHTDIDSENLGAQISKELGFSHTQASIYQNAPENEEIIDQEDGIDALFDENAKKLLKRKLKSMINQNFTLIFRIFFFFSKF